MKNHMENSMDFGEKTINLNMGFSYRNKPGRLPSGSQSRDLLGFSVQDPMNTKIFHLLNPVIEAQWYTSG